MQAEAGAPLIPSPVPDASPTPSSPSPSTPPGRPARSRRSLFAVLIGAAVTVYAADQLTKAWAVAALPPEQPRHLIGVGPAAGPHPQPRRGVLDRHRLHVGPHARGLQRRRGDRGHEQAPRQPGVGVGARPPARRLAGQPHRPDGPRRRARAAGTSWTSCSCRTGRSSTSPTRPIVSAAVLIGFLALRGIGVDGARAPRARARARRGRGAATMADVRTLPVPDGLEGERVDAALARLFGLSRTKAADLAAAGAVTLDQRSVGKSDRVVAGAWLEVSLPDADAAAGPELVAEPVPGMTDRPRRRRHRRRRQAGRRRRAPERRLDRPDRPRRPGRRRLPHLDLGRRRAAGHRAPPRRRHLRPDGRRQERARLHRAQARLQGAHGRQDLPRRSCRACPTRCVGTIDAPIGRHPGHDYKFAVISDGKPQRHPLRGARGLPARRPCWRSTSRPGAPTRSGCTSPRCATPAPAT